MKAFRTVAGSRQLPTVIDASQENESGTRGAMGSRSLSGPHLLGPKRRRVRSTHVVSAFAALVVGLCVGAEPARAFPHVVQEGETLAQLAERYYGRIQNERVLVVANGLDRGDGTTIVPGLVLDIPATTHYRVRLGDTWQSLGKDLLGAPERGEFLSLSNDQKPWIQPEPGRILRIPYNLALVSTGQDSLPTIAYRYLGSTKQAWSISRYNRLEERKLVRGDVFLVPVTELDLTEEGQKAVARAAQALSAEGDAPQRAQQRKVEGEVPALIADVQGGRYVFAVARGVKLLSSGELSEVELGRIHRQLLEAYVALDAVGQAVEACGKWLKYDKTAKLDPVFLSPKILDACARAPGPAASAGAAASAAPTGSVPSAAVPSTAPAGVSPPPKSP